jgi:hypothetical protein
LFSAKWKRVVAQIVAGTRPHSAGYFCFWACGTKILREKLSMGCRMSVWHVVHWPHKLLPASDYHIRMLLLLTVLALLKTPAIPPLTTATNTEAKGNNLAANGKRL